MKSGEVGTAGAGQSAGQGVVVTGGACLALQSECS